MNVVVDANIVFSGILNTNGKIADLLINSYGLFGFIAPDFLRAEIRKHQTKLAELSGLSPDQIVESEFQICKDIGFISEEQVSPENWTSAFELVKDIDPKDLPYVALSMQFGYKIWSGDKVLIRGLEKKGFKDILTTQNLFNLRKEIKIRKKGQPK